MIPYARSKYVLNEAPNRNDATGLANTGNVRLTTMGAIQFSICSCLGTIGESKYIC